MMIKMGLKNKAKNGLASLVLLGSSLGFSGCEIQRNNMNNYNNPSPINNRNYVRKISKDVEKNTGSSNLIEHGEIEFMGGTYKPTDVGIKTDGKIETYNSRGEKIIREYSIVRTDSGETFRVYDVDGDGKITFADLVLTLPKK